MTYAMKTRTSLGMEEAEAKVRAALADEGFGVLTEIDVAGVLKTKLDLDTTPYRILGACNPHLASDALDKERDVGLLLPCNVVVYEDGDGTVVAAMDPDPMIGIAGNAALEPIAKDARSRLERVIAAVGD